MKILVNTGSNLAGNEELVARVEAAITKALSHFRNHVTRVEVHLSDENGDKHGQHDKRCMIEARLQGRRPIAVSCEAPTLVQAVAGAADRLKSSLGTTLDQLHAHR